MIAEFLRRLLLGFPETPAQTKQIQSLRGQIGAMKRESRQMRKDVEDLKSRVDEFVGVKELH